MCLWRETRVSTPALQGRGRATQPARCGVTCATPGLAPPRKGGGGGEGCIIRHWGSPMHPLEWATSPVPDCCAHAMFLTITRATQLVVRVAAVLDQVLHIAMFNLRRLCTAPLCRQKMLSWPRGPSPGHHPHLWQVPPQFHLPCQATPAFIRAPVPPPLPWKVPVAVAVSSTVQARPAISSTAGLQGGEGTLSRGLLPTCSQSVDSTRTNALSRRLPPQEGRGLTLHPWDCPSDTAWRSHLGQTWTLLL